MSTSEFDVREWIDSHASLATWDELIAAREYLVKELEYLEYSMSHGEGETCWGHGTGPAITYKKDLELLSRVSVVTIDAFQRYG